MAREGILRHRNTGPTGMTVTRRNELLVAGFALLTVLAAQFFVSQVIQGTNFYGGDGKMVLSHVLSAFKFGAPFDVTGLSAVQGMGSQMMPKNGWANPSFWPFA